MKQKVISEEERRSPEYQIELARKSMARIPEWLYNGSRINGSNIKKGKKQ